MQQHYRLAPGWQQKFPMHLIILLFLVLTFALVSHVQAQAQFVTVRVLIEKASFAGCDDRPFDLFPEIYFRVRINNLSFRTGNVSPGGNIIPISFPVNREFSLNVDFSLGTIPIRIEQFDADPGNDDKCDFKQGPGNDVNVNLDLVTCKFSGNLNGECGTTIQTSVFLDQAVFFKITVDEPPRTPGLAIRCLHTPIWPQPGDTVGIIAEALDGNGNLITGQPVDNIEIWADNTNAPIATTATIPGLMGNSALAAIHTPAPGADQFLYRCRAVDTNAGVTERVSSNWRRVQIGQPARGRAVGILNTGVSNNRIDIVFIADPDYMGGANDPQFLSDVRTVIRNAYYAGDANFQAAGLLFLQAQDMINFWIALDPGNASFVSNRCRLNPPDNWNSAYTFADAGAIIHTAPATSMVRNCASPGRRLFSARSERANTVLHETGHVPFGLADEYCCDGGYFPKFASPDDLPNVYDRQAACLMDQLAFEVTDACQPISGNACQAGPNLNKACTPDAIGQDPAGCGAGIACALTRLSRFRLDPLSTVTNDLMVGSGNLAPQRADQRRINRLFSICRGATDEC